MKIGLELTRFDWPGTPQIIGPKLVEIATTVERMGFDSLWMMDHFFQIGYGHGPAEAPMLEAYSTMAYLAAVTQRVKIGLSVTNNICRHPTILVKTVTTLDVLSGGRAYFGIGAGGMYEREIRGLGLPLTSLKERFERLEETLQIAHQMWRGDVTPYTGKYYQLTEPLNSPQPLSQPHPPILIGGEGEEKTLRLVAQYADACNFLLGTPLPEYTPWQRALYRNRKERLPRKLDKLREHCRRVGRSYDEIERTVLGPIKIGPDAMTAIDIIRLCQELAEMGFHHIIFNMPNVHEIIPLEMLGNEVIPTITEL